MVPLKRVALLLVVLVLSVPALAGARPSAPSPDDGLVEVYASEETGTWTILMTRPDGTTCLLAAGQRWEQDARPLGKPGSDA